ncbi:MAG: helix-turn-helix domain-containing protein [Pseudomonadota bacterium]
MRTLDLKEAAAFLHIHPVTLLRKAQAGEIPGAKPGKCWVFLDIDLADYLRSNYARRASSDGGGKEKFSCPSIDGKDRRSGISTLTSTDDEYAEALGLTTGRRPKSTTTA